MSSVLVEESVVVVEVNYTSLKFQVGIHEPDKLPILELKSSIYLDKEVDLNQVDLLGSKAVVEEKDQENEPETQNGNPNEIEKEIETKTDLKEKVTLLSLFLSGKVKVHLSETDDTNQFSQLELVTKGEKFQWEVLKVLLYYSLIVQLQLDLNNQNLLVVYPSELDILELQVLVKLVFETFNLLQVGFLDKSCATCYGLGLTSGLVLEISDRTICSVVLDCKVLTSSISKSQFNLEKLDKLILEKLKQDESLTQVLKDKFGLELVRFLRLNGYISFEDMPKRNPKEKGEVEKVMVQYQSTQFELGDIRYMGSTFQTSFSVEPSLLNLIQQSTYYIDKEKKLTLYDTILVDSELVVVPGFYSALEKVLNLLKTSDFGGIYQPPQLTFTQFPDYFTQLKKTPYHLPLLGATIAAKYILGDPKLCVSKVDYNELGPNALYSKI